MSASSSKQELRVSHSLSSVSCSLRVGNTSSFCPRVSIQKVPLLYHTTSCKKNTMVQKQLQNYELQKSNFTMCYRYCSISNAMLFFPLTENLTTLPYIMLFTHMHKIMFLAACLENLLYRANVLKPIKYIQYFS